MNDPVLYVHGKGGDAAESAHYAPLFPGSEVVGAAWRSSTPREAGREIRGAAEALCRGDKRIILIANSIGAYFCMNAGMDALVRRAYFISPIVDMERLILDMAAAAGVTEAELAAKGVIPTPSGEPLSWDYLCDVRAHPPRWTAPTEILYGEHDALTSLATVSAFAKAHRSGLTVMKGGEHWFHTEAQMRFLDEWILRDRGAGA